MARRILVVEDEPTLRETLAEALEADGFTVDQAGDGRAALEQFRRVQPDLLLLDLMLPELSGLEVTRQVRAESSVPIVMLTARDAEVDKVVGLELGADDYVTKPFSLRELSARIRAVLRRFDGQAGSTGGDANDLAGPRPEPIDVGRVQVDLAGHRILRDGDVFPVKPKVFDLLAYLLRHRGQVVTRDQLLEQVWGYDYPGETRTVDVHVHWLRAVIEHDPSKPTLLETVRGTGYVLRRSA
ncbi:MAG TPA: response regulator transcription factor [Candidatus Limnocylindria bacterium]|nr:response regulator transcription factor [Candidatus Limnocylindria bacterium]